MQPVLFDTQTNDTLETYSILFSKSKKYSVTSADWSIYNQTMVTNQFFLVNQKHLVGPV